MIFVNFQEKTVLRGKALTINNATFFYRLLKMSK
jgi:hypothetical protein